MVAMQALLYFVAIVMIVVGAFPYKVGVNFAVLGAGVALLAYAMPTLTAVI
jgi:hypothetical protein